MSEEYINQSLEKFTKRKKEISLFENSVNKVREKDDHESTQLIEEYTKSKKIVADQITSGIGNLSSTECQRMVKSLLDELEKVRKKLSSYQFHELNQTIHLWQVCDELMNIEVRQVEKFERLEDEFENRLNEMKNESIESQQLFFRSVEGQQEKFTAGLKALATDLIDRLARDELDQVK